MTLRRLACLLLGHRWNWSYSFHVLGGIGLLTPSRTRHCLRCGEPHP